MVGDQTRAAILALAETRGEASFCPSEAARALDAQNWRGHLLSVRRAAIALAREGAIDILRKGKKVAEPAEVRGVIRLRLARPGQAALPDAGHRAAEPEADPVIGPMNGPADGPLDGPMADNQG